MSADPVFVDTNVLVYQWDLSEPRKQERASNWMRVLWRTKRGRLSAQVLSEFYSAVTQKLKPGLRPPAAQWNVRTLTAWKPLPVDAALIERAFDVQQRFRTSWWDALIVAAAQAARARVLLSEDFQDGQEFDDHLRVMHPFRHAPEEA